VFERSPPEPACRKRWPNPTDRSHDVSTNLEDGADAPLCTFDERWHGSAVVVSCVGEIDMTTSPELERRIALAMEKSPTSITVDMSRVDFLASSGMSVLVATHQHCSPTVGFAVVAHGPMTRRPMELLGITDIITVHTSLDVALKAVTR
jgi:anti-anti-sigma factor